MSKIGAWRCLMWLAAVVVVGCLFTDLPNRFDFQNGRAFVVPILALIAIIIGVMAHERIRSRGDDI